MILGYEANIGLIYYGPKWSWAEMVMGQNDPESLVVMIFSFIIMNLSTESTNVVEKQPKLLKECLNEFQ